MRRILLHSPVENPPRWSFLPTPPPASHSACPPKEGAKPRHSDLLCPRCADRSGRSRSAVCASRPCRGIPLRILPLRGPSPSISLSSRTCLPTGRRSEGPVVDSPHRLPLFGPRRPCPPLAVTASGRTLGANPRGSPPYGGEPWRARLCPSPACGAAQFSPGWKPWVKSRKGRESPGGRHKRAPGAPGAAFAPGGVPALSPRSHPEESSDEGSLCCPLPFEHARPSWDLIPGFSPR